MGWKGSDYVKFWGCIVAFDITALAAAITFALETKDPWTPVVLVIAFTACLMSLSIGSRLGGCFKQPYAMSKARTIVLAWTAFSVIPGCGLGFIAASLGIKNSVGLAAGGVMMILFSVGLCIFMRESEKCPWCKKNLVCK